MDPLRAKSRRLRVAVVTNALPHYREDFYRLLFQCEELDLKVFCQDRVPGLNLELVHDRFSDHVTLVRVLALKREMLGWQRLPWRRLLSSFDVLFVIGNPRILSNMALAGVARFLGRPVVIWGQAHTAGAGGVGEWLRLWWWKRFDHLFVYTDREVGWLRERGLRRQHIVGMNNGLDQRRIDSAAAAWNAADPARWRREQGIESRTVVLSCARLEAKNRFDWWIEAMPAVVARFPDLLWCVIGDGAERERLQARARSVGVAERVRWLGVILDEAELAPWFLSSRLLIHPSGIGLTLLHAFGYGLPVITHDDEAHQMPEFAAFVPGGTGLCYRYGDTGDLAEVVARGLGDEPALGRLSEVALRIAREEYNVQVMAKRFVDMALHAGARS